jgi:bis(5'-nucleosidyl)-tetraphosphatase
MIYCIETLDPDKINEMIKAENNKIKHIPIIGAGIICININNVTGRHKLFLMQYNKKWGFPKGHINANESYTDCAKREFYEETGIAIGQNFKYFFISNKIVYFIIYTDQFCYDINNVITKNEVSRLSWMDIKDINNKKIYDYSDTNIGIKHFCQIFYKYKKFNTPYMNSYHNSYTNNKNYIINNKTFWR